MSVHRRDFLKRAAGAGAAAGLAARSGDLLAAAGRVGPAEDLPQPRFGRKQGATANRAMVTTSNVHATRAALDVLKAGGNACDAALCASVVQTITEPHMTAITGILSMLYYNAGTGKTEYVNGGTNAPLAGLPAAFDADLAPGLGAAVGGFWPAFEAAHARYGSKPKAEIVRPAIDYARDGFPVHPFLYGSMFGAVAKIGLTEQGREIYMPDGALVPPGGILKNARGAEALQRLVEEGEGYWRGDFARRYSEVVGSAGGVITPEDFEKYQARWQEPARGMYRGYEIAGSPPPDNGGTHVIEALNMIEVLDLQRLGPPSQSADTFYWLLRIAVEVMTEGAKQRDPNSHRVPLDTILSKDYARMRFELLQMAPPRGAIHPTIGTNHVTVVDAKSNIAAITHSIAGGGFGTQLYVDGLNITANAGTTRRGMALPGDRASAYIAPNLIFGGGKPILASGSPSVSIVANILQNTVNILDFGMSVEESVHRPRFGGARGGGRPMVEADVPDPIRSEIARRGIAVDVVSPWFWSLGAYEGIHIEPASGMLTACADPRRTGHAEGY